MKNNEYDKYKDLLDYFTNRYYKELEKKDEIYTSLIHQSTIIVAVMTALIIFYEQVSRITNDCKLIFTILLFVSFLIISMASFYVISALYGYTYSYTGEASKLFECWKKSEDKKEYLCGVIERICESIDKNYHVNSERIKKRVMAYRMISISLLILFFTFLMFIIISMK